MYVESNATKENQASQVKTLSRLCYYDTLIQDFNSSFQESNRATFLLKVLVNT